MCVEDVGLCAYVIYTEMDDGEPRRRCIILVMCKKWRNFKRNVAAILNDCLMDVISILTWMIMVDECILSRDCYNMVSEPWVCYRASIGWV